MLAILIPEGLTSSSVKGTCNGVVEMALCLSSFCSRASPAAAHMLAFLGCLCFLGRHSTTVTSNILGSPLHLSLRLPLREYVLCDLTSFLLQSLWKSLQCYNPCILCVFKISIKGTMQRSAASRISYLGPLAWLQWPRGTLEFWGNICLDQGFKT